MGSHTAEAYSKCGLTKAWDDNIRFLRKIPSVLFALLDASDVGYMPVPF